VRAGPARLLSALAARPTTPSARCLPHRSTVNRLLLSRSDPLVACYAESRRGR